LSKIKAMIMNHVT